MLPHKPPSAIRVDGEIAYIFLREGCEAIIDAADIHLVAGRRWRLLTTKKRHKYACSGQSRDGTFTTLHRFLARPLDNLKVDHRDGDGLNNRRKNIRPATGTQNNANCSASRKNKLGVKGVAFLDGLENGFVASIKINGKSKHLGRFKTAEEASGAYLSAAQEAWGEFARK